MTTHASPWEQRLVSLAQSAPAGQILPRTLPLNRCRLRLAHRLCSALTAEHSRTFYLASGLLFPRERRAVRTLYAFCRLSDDVVDRSRGDRAARFQLWRTRILADFQMEDDLVALAWRATRNEFHIPEIYVEQFLDGVARDLTPPRYERFDDLAEYCYGVAATVGLIAMYIVGFKGPEAIPYAVKLGVALQMTNILRDVGEDWANGRLYLPHQELAAFDLSPEDIEAGKVDDRWRAFMRFQIARTRHLYTVGLSGLGWLAPRGRLAIAAAAHLYAAILEDIEVHDYDVFKRRAFVGSWGKIARLPAVGWGVVSRRSARLP